MPPRDIATYRRRETVLSQGRLPAGRPSSAGVTRSRHGCRRSRPAVKKRLDVLLFERGLAESRAQAQALVMAGQVPGYEKPGHQVDEASPTLTVARGPAYVSRGGEKLAHGLDTLGVDPAGLDCLDLGASTGGFSDVLLQRGAARVVAVDVGYGQLHSAPARRPARHRPRAHERARPDRAPVRAAARRLRRLVHLRSDRAAAGAAARGARLAGARPRQAAVRGRPRRRGQGRRRPRRRPCAPACSARSPPPRLAGGRRSPAS